MQLRGITEDPPRSGRYRIRFTDQEGRDRREWCTSLEEAQAKLRLRKEQVESGTFRKEMLGRWSASKKKRLTDTSSGGILVGDVIEEVLAESLATLRDKRSDRRFAKEWKRELGLRTLDEVTSEDIKRWRRRRQAGEPGRAPLKPATINRYTMFLSKVFTHACENGYTANHPVRASRRSSGGLQRLEEDNAQDQILLPEQQKALAQVMRPSDFRIVCLAVETGMRAGNLFELRREWIDTGRRAIRIPSGHFKGKREQLVRLSSFAIRLLESIMEEHDDEWLFPSDHGKNRSGHLAETAWYRRRWLPALKAAGIPKMRFHACRATCATRMLEAGASIEEVRQQLGHATLTMVLRYARIVEQHHSDVLERMSAITAATLMSCAFNGSDFGSDGASGSESGSQKVVPIRQPSAGA